MKNGLIGAMAIGVGAFSVAGSASAYTHSGQTTIAQSSDVTSSANTGSLVIGNTTGAQIAIDSNEIQARAANGGTAPLALQASGGELRVGSPEDRIRISAGEVATDGTQLDLRVDGEVGMFIYRPTSDELYLMLDGTRVEVRSPLLVKDGMYISGGVTADACLSSGWLKPCASSARYKTDIADLLPGLSAVLAMRPVSFRYKESGLPSMGFIAEEAVSTLPNLITREENGTIQGFDYKGYTAVLTHAVQEQQRMIEELDTRLQVEHTARATLTERVAAQDRELSSMRKELARLSADFATVASQLPRSLKGVVAETRSLR